MPGDDNEQRSAWAETVGAALAQPCAADAGDRAPELL